ncbi:hypothetical protein N7504_005867 [Penicillium tannophilum]|nr:hypothetical protein N7504_005867 [Penicillium tannophilum]
MAFISMAALDAEGVVGKRVGILAVLLHEDRGVLFGKRIASATDVRQDLSIQYVDTSILDMLYPEPGDIGEFKGIPTFVGKDLILYAVCGIEKPVTQIWCIE